MLPITQAKPSVRITLLCLMAFVAVRSDTSHAKLQNLVISQAGVCQCVTGVNANRLLEVNNRIFQGVICSLAPKIATLAYALTHVFKTCFTAPALKLIPGDSRHHGI
jgi:hypothetical protein